MRDNLQFLKSIRFYHTKEEGGGGGKTGLQPRSQGLCSLPRLSLRNSQRQRRRRRECFEARNCGQSSCRCTLDQWLDLIGVITS